jgi:hypothetical protein
MGVSVATNEEQQRIRTPFSAKLPQASLEDVTPVVEALAELGAPSTPHVIAQQLGTSYATNARFRTRLGAAGYYGLIEKEGKLRRLTARGEAVTGNDASAGQRARREAVMSTTFGPIIYSLRGRAVNETAIALRVRQDHNANEAAAPTIARALVESAKQADLVANDRFDAAAIEAVANVIPSGEESASPASTGKKEKPERRTETKQEAAKKQQAESAAKEGTASPFVSGVQVVVKIDASNLTPLEIAELVRALQSTTESQDS